MIPIPANGLAQNDMTDHRTIVACSSYPKKYEKKVGILFGHLYMKYRASEMILRNLQDSFRLYINCLNGKCGKDLRFLIVNIITSVCSIESESIIILCR